MVDDGMVDRCSDRDSVFARSRMSDRRAPVSGPKETHIEVSYRHEQFWPPHSPALFDDGRRVTRSAVR